MLKFHIIPVTPFQQNCTVFWCDQTMQAAVVDPGGEIDKISAFLEQQQLRLVNVWLTHAHLDHAGAADLLAKKFSVPIEGPHKDDKFWLDRLPQQVQLFGFGQATAFEPTRWLEAGDLVTVGNETLSVLYCPGHTPGHVAFYHAETQIVQVGDILFNGSIGRTDFPRGNQAQLIDSITRNLLTLADDVQFIPGHGPMGTIGHERRTNPYVGSKALAAK